eukprot:PhF_6_TR12990/c0_g1_i1/m.20551
MATKRTLEVSSDEGDAASDASSGVSENLNIHDKNPSGVVVVDVPHSPSRMRSMSPVNEYASGTCSVCLKKTPKVLCAACGHLPLCLGCCKALHQNRVLQSHEYFRISDGACVRFCDLNSLITSQEKAAATLPTSPAMSPARGATLSQQQSSSPTQSSTALQRCANHVSNRTTYVCLTCSNLPLCNSCRGTLHARCDCVQVATVTTTRLDENVTYSPAHGLVLRNMELMRVAGEIRSAAAILQSRAEQARNDVHAKMNEIRRALDDLECAALEEVDRKVSIWRVELVTVSGMVNESIFAVSTTMEDLEREGGNPAFHPNVVGAITNRNQLLIDTSLKEERAREVVRRSEEAIKIVNSSPIFERPFSVESLKVGIQQVGATLKR